MERSNQISRNLLIFFAVIAVVSLGLGMSDVVYANYFKDAYQVSATQRGLIEFPRELPGILCVLVMALLSGLGDIRTGIIAQLLACIGLMALGLLSPPMGVMLIFLFINSMGTHLFLPLQESICMSLSEPDCIGKRLGQFSSVRSAFSFIAALIVFFGFRFAVFSFKTPVKLPFIIGAITFFIGAAGLTYLSLQVNRQQLSHRRKLVKPVLRKEYRYYYCLAILQGVQKQIAYVYGTWVLVDLLLKQADTVAILTIIGNFIGIFFTAAVGRWMDRYGVKRMLFVEAVTFIGVYILYGIMAAGISGGNFSAAGLSVVVVYMIYIMDRMSTQMGIVRSAYLRSIAVDESEVTSTLSLGLSFDHVVSILMAIIGGFIWDQLGCQWVFFIAAAFSLGNLFISLRIKDPKKGAPVHAVPANAKKDAIIGE